MKGGVDGLGLEMSVMGSLKSFFWNGLMAQTYLSFHSDHHLLLSHFPYNLYKISVKYDQALERIFTCAPSAVESYHQLLISNLHPSASLLPQPSSVHPTSLSSPAGPPSKSASLTQSSQLHPSGTSTRKPPTTSPTGRRSRRKRWDHWTTTTKK